MLCKCNYHMGDTAYLTSFYTLLIQLMYTMYAPMKKMTTCSMEESWSGWEQIQQYWESWSTESACDVWKRHRIGAMMWICIVSTGWSLIWINVGYLHSFSVEKFDNGEMAEESGYGHNCCWSSIVLSQYECKTMVSLWKQVGRIKTYLHGYLSTEKLR